MVGENSLDFENKLIKQIPGFFENLPTKFSKEPNNSPFEIIQNFCFCKKKNFRNFFKF